MKLPAASVTKRFQTSSVHSMHPQRIIAELSGEGSSDGTMVGLSESLAGGETKIGLRVVGCSDDDGVGVVGVLDGVLVVNGVVVGLSVPIVTGLLLGILSQQGM